MFLVTFLALLDNILYASLRYSLLVAFLCTFLDSLYNVEETDLILWEDRCLARTLWVNVVNRYKVVQDAILRLMKL
ncbi:hypothetical protein DJ524_06725 [Sulfolobus sp. D5]|nr:hypothetical protein DJ528_09030 [Sulfolobus sp. B5]TRM80697.1 hypothetical protein DJ524_06725 [Sulfolobus sp. D5]TRM84461.1 hypothetical protein DJ522_04660 [Sulfolobus sp. F3]TRM89138.1 hypothetical protein DJ526_08435 [Sulfolobus sp. A20-N-G8]